jgi:hypothetical protein
MGKPRRNTKIRIAPRRANQPVLQAEHFLTPGAERGLEGVNRRISAIEEDIASRPSIDDFRQFMIGQIAEQIKAVGSPFIHRMGAAQPTAATIFPALETEAAVGPARPMSLEQELGVVPGKPLSELTDAMQRVMAGEAGPQSTEGASPDRANDELAMEAQRQQSPRPTQDPDAVPTAAQAKEAAGIAWCAIERLAHGLLLGTGLVWGIAGSGYALWKVWPWINQLAQ